MANSIKRILIVGGGSAGWLSAAVLAAAFKANDEGISVTLVESPDVKSIGVGEGTWPSMCATLRRIGVSESDFIRSCDASFKQGSKFVGWYDGSDNDSYYHPFSLPQGFSHVNLAEQWLENSGEQSFARSVTPQIDVCDAFRAPKQLRTPEYACNLNYAYHLDAGKFAKLLQRHSVENLGVNHVVDHMTDVKSSVSGDIHSIVTRMNGELSADLFVDCSGFSSLLLGEHLGVPFRDCKSVLFNDSALAVQMPHDDENAPIASATVSTAQRAGWIWDIALPTRRGIGHVYSSAHTSAEQAEVDLRGYLKSHFRSYSDNAITVREIPINPGYREKFWHRNCLAIGLSAGFLEPLEASALVLVEQSAKTLAENMPANRETMDIVAERFNEKFNFRWAQIIDFLKLHYVLSKRVDNQYWLENRQVDTIPESLQKQLLLWRTRAPWHQDTIQVDEMFPAASYQYVLYGMKYETVSGLHKRRDAGEMSALATDFFSQNIKNAKKMITHLPSNRELLKQLQEQSFPRQ